MADAPASRAAGPTDEMQRALDSVAPLLRCNRCPQEENCPACESAFVRLINAVDATAASLERAEAALREQADNAVIAWEAQGETDCYRHIKAAVGDPPCNAKHAADHACEIFGRWLRAARGTTGEPT